MKHAIIISIIFAYISPDQAFAYRNCDMECPINFAPPSDPHNPLQGYQDRQNCLSRCQQANSEQSELEQQTIEMQEQTKLLKEQQEEQQLLQNENEELRERLENLEDNQDSDE